MSRTIRRRRAKHRESSFVPDIDRLDSWDFSYTRTTNPKACQAKLLAWFHADNHSGEWNAPSWYARHINKQVDRATKQVLHHTLRTDAWDGFICPRYLRNANWNWW